jgi:PAS domain S-box-containing protein
LQISKAIGARTIEARNYLGLASVYSKTNERLKSIIFGTNALAIAKEIGDADLIKENTLILAKTSASIGNFRAAYEYHTIYKSVSDSLLNEENIKKIVGLEFEFNYEKEQELLRIEQDKREELHQAELKRKNLVRNYLFIALILLSLLAFFIYRSYLNKLRVNKLLNDQKNSIQQINSELERQNLEILTAKQLAEESETKFRILVDNVPGVIFRCINDPSWTMIYISHAIEEIVGYPETDFLNDNIRTFNSIIHPDYRVEVNSTIQKSVTERESYSISYQVVCSNQSVKWVREIGQGVYDKDGKLKYIDGVITDITKLINTQEQLSKSEAKLIELNSTKDKFFSIIGHDLKNPFNTLINFSELLLESPEKLSDTERGEVLKMINDVSKNTHSLLVNLLDWAKSQSGKIQLKKEDFNLSDLSLDVIELLNEVAKNKNIDIFNEIPIGITVYADKNMIKTTIRNLISNAIKFTKEGGSIKLFANMLNGIVEVSVADTGIGMDQETKNSLFKIDKTTSLTGTSGETGSGLGLILCKEFVEKNNGKIWVESELGKGSVFRFTLPCVKNEN